MAVVAHGGAVADCTAAGQLAGDVGTEFGGVGRGGPTDQGEPAAFAGVCGGRLGSDVASVLNPRSFNS